MGSSADMTALGQSSAGATSSASRTDWDQVRDASDPNAARHSQSLERIARRYWPVIHAFIRHSGRSDDEARDLTQGFLADVLFGRGLLGLATPSRGRFRTLLLRAVTNYLHDDHRRRTATARHPGVGRLILHGAPPTLADHALSPHTAFTSAWVAMLIGAAAERCRIECLGEHQEAQWLCLEHRVIRPAMEGAVPATNDELRRMTGLSTTPRISHALASAKRRFARLLLEEIGTTTEDPTRIHEELADLLQMLQGGRSSLERA